MPTLLNGAVPLKGTTGTNTYFIQLSGAQPNLGRTPTTTTGYTLVTGPNGQLTFTNTLGLISFNNGVIQTTVPNGDITIQSTGTGAVNLNGKVLINGQQVNAGAGNFSNLTVTELLVYDSATVALLYANTASIQNLLATAASISNATATNLSVPNQANISVLNVNTGSFFNLQSTSSNFTLVTAHQITADILNVNTETIFYKLLATGAVTLDPIGQDVSIAPTSGGTVYINPGRTGLIDNMIIGTSIPAAGYFTNVITNNLQVANPVSFTTASITGLTVSHFTATSDVALTNVAVTGSFTATTLSAGTLFDNGHRVLTNVTAVSGPGISATASVAGTTATVTVTNTGVLSLIAGTGTAVSSTTGNVTVWSTASFQTVTDNGASSNHIITLNNATQSTTSTNGALVVSGGIGVGGNVEVAGDVYSTGGSPYYNRLLYTPQVTVSATAPNSPRIGDFWIDPTVGVEYQYVPNGGSAIWIQFIGF